MSTTIASSPRRRLGPRPAACVAAALLSAATAAGAATFNARSYTKTFPPTADNTQSFNVSGSGPQTVSSQSQGSLAMGGTQVDIVANAHAVADGGGLHLNIDAIGSTLPSATFDFAQFSAQARASGSFSDRYFVNAPSLPVGAQVSAMAGFAVYGTLGGNIATTGVVLDPTFSPSGGSNASWTASMNFNGNRVFSGERSCGTNLDANGISAYNCVGDNFGVFWMPVVLVNGFNNSLSFDGEIRLAIFGTQGWGVTVLSQSYADLGHTIGWAGLRDVQDANGQPVTMTAISTSTGLSLFDPQVSPVPEPAAAWTWAAGLAAMAALLRRRGRR
jgi:MYXO-CTERM domain-containing protein